MKMIRRGNVSLVGLVLQRVDLVLEYVTALVMMASLLILFGTVGWFALSEIIAKCKTSPYGVLNLMVFAFPWLFCKLLMWYLDPIMRSTRPPNATQVEIEAIYSVTNSQIHTPEIYSVYEEELGTSSAERSLEFG